MASKLNMPWKRPWLGLASGLVLLYLWGNAFRQLAVSWSNNPQYSYGWGVPFLCAYLIWHRIRGQRLPPPDLRLPSSVPPRLPASGFYFLLALGVFFYLPIRLIQEANPDWSLVSWGLALLAVGGTLIVLNWFGGRQSIQRFAFPVAFFLVAVPWPTMVEDPLIQTLTQVDVNATCELAGLIGIPTLAHGNVIEVATGQVNVDEACSGIRSFQATLMISLFLGELYQLTVGRRAVCLVAGFLLALLLNLARLLVLVWVATRQGIPAISRWHDPTGVLILLGCFSALWFIGQWLARGNPPSAHRPPATEHRPSSPTRSTLHASSSNRLAFALLAWIGLVEFAVSGWYAWRVWAAART